MPPPNVKTLIDSAKQRDIKLVIKKLIKIINSLSLFQNIDNINSNYIGMNKNVSILSLTYLTHNVILLKIEKPQNFDYKIGQAVEVSLIKENNTEIKSVFTITSIPTDDHLSFIIKIPEFRNKFIKALIDAAEGDKMNVYVPFGGIEYKGEGVFVAGGAGIAPFIPILRDLKTKGELGNSKLIFANRTEIDIVLKEYLHELLGDRFINILSEEEHEDYSFGFATSKFIQQNNSENLKYYYLCGPKPMLDIIEEGLLAENIKKEYILKEGF